MQTIIYHNPRCSKSREALALLEARGIPHRVVEYLKTPPDRATLTAIARVLDGGIQAMVRTKDPLFAELGLADATDARLLDALVEQPALLERPLVVHDGRAALGRPPANVLALFER
ncbi:MAG: arsenate reductase (glutaredoxin) [Gammaproteobacteria bacterium]